MIQSNARLSKLSLITIPIPYFYKEYMAIIRFSSREAAVYSSSNVTDPQCGRNFRTKGLLIVSSISCMEIS